MERRPVVVARFSLLQEEGGVVRSLFGEDFDDEVPLGGFKDHLLADHRFDRLVGGEEALGLGARHRHGKKAENEERKRPHHPGV